MAKGLPTSTTIDEYHAAADMQPCGEDAEVGAFGQVLTNIYRMKSTPMSEDRRAGGATTMRSSGRMKAIENLHLSRDANIQRFGLSSAGAAGFGNIMR